ncbi:hypothetical protein CDN99_13420 [Roseateles aquatilis]|uniref:DUF86 domain-containing protein n=1 Tax=Roseateles aquatilis TaxID=431061 RepID=A0A246JDQ8_9BURK|nr:hypothetical protein CDN99_13420 [Roseateles aquatilis]
MAVNARDVVQWLSQSQAKLQDAGQTTISNGTRMDATWDAVLLACMAVACAQGWRMTSDRGHHVVVLEGACHALGLSELRFDELDILRDWRNRKYRAGYSVDTDELAEALEWVAPFLRDVATWFDENHRAMIKRGVAP